MKNTPGHLDAWLNFISGTHPSTIAMGLERVRQVAERLDVLRPAPRVLTVAGTNGKGSTCMFAEALLRADGLKVGTTLSPHLRDFNERIRIAGENLSDSEVCVALGQVEAARGDVELTYFEYAILGALVAFRDAQVDVAILEVGLGGRLDATNIVDADVAVITMIGFDHMDYLGDDLESIGAEKAGILRPGAPLVVGQVDIPESVRQRAAALACPVYQIGRDFRIACSDAGWTYSAGPAQEVPTGPFAPARLAADNVAAALQAVVLLNGRSPSRQAIQTATEGATLPGRCEQFRVGASEVVLDVAHNPDGAAFLARQLRQLKPLVRTRAVAGFLKDKNVAGIVGALQDEIQDWTFVATGTDRGQSGADALSVCNDGPVCVATELSVAQVLASLLERASGGGAPGGERIVVLGSFDVVQAARVFLRADVARGAVRA